MTNKTIITSKIGNNGQCLPSPVITLPMVSAKLHMTVGNSNKLVKGKTHVNKYKIEYRSGERKKDGNTEIQKEAVEKLQVHEHCHDYNNTQTLTDVVSRLTCYNVQCESATAVSNKH
jgi:hypothetical protein